MTAHRRAALGVATAVIVSALCAAAYAVTATGALAPRPHVPGHASPPAHGSPQHTATPPGTATPRTAPAPATPPGASAGPFGATPLPADQQYELAGRVEERLAAGSYHYLRIRPDGQAGDHWIVLSGDPGAARARIRVRVMARAEHFRSRRLDREFAVLLFASLVTDSPPATH